MSDLRRVDSSASLPTVRGGARRRGVQRVASTRVALVALLVTALGQRAGVASDTATSSAEDVTAVGRRSDSVTTQTETQRLLRRQMADVEAELHGVESLLDSRRKQLASALESAQAERDELVESLDARLAKDLEKLAAREREGTDAAGELKPQLATELDEQRAAVESQHKTELEAIVEAHTTAKLAIIERWQPEIDQLQELIAGIRNRLGELDSAVASAGLAETRAAEALGLRESFFRERFPATLQGTGSGPLGIEAWQWIMLGLLVLAAVVVSAFVRLVTHWAMSRIARWLPDELLEGLERPVGIVAASALFFAILGGLGLPPTAQTILILATRLVLSLGLVWALWRAVDVVAAQLERRARRTATKLDDLLIPAGRRVVKMALAVVGALFVANASGVRPQSLLAGLGLGGLAFALAAKDTVENLFGFVTLLFDEPFKVGDWIKVDDVEGTVEEVGMRSTRIRTFYDSLVTLPNRQLVNAMIDNLGARTNRRLSTHIDIAYGTPTETVEMFCEGIREIIRLHPYTRKDSYHVYLNALGESSLQVLLYVFHQVPDWATELRERHRLFVDILKLAERLEVEIAFPTRTLHVPGLEASAFRSSVDDETSEPREPRPTRSVDAARSVRPATGRAGERTGRRAAKLAFELVSEGLPDLRVPPPVEIAARSSVRAARSISRIVTSSPLFSMLDDAHREALVERCRELRLGDGATAIREGEPGDSMFIIASGTLDVVCTDENGSTGKVGGLGVGDSFGEMSLLTGEPRTATVVATTDSDLVCVPKQALEPVLKDQPELAERLAELMAERQAANAARQDEGEQSLDSKRRILTRVRRFFGLRQDSADVTGDDDPTAA